MANNKSISRRIPSIRSILNMAIRELVKRYGVSNLMELRGRISFSEIAIELERIASDIYRKLERAALIEYLIDRGLNRSDAEKVADIIVGEEDITKEISNIRRARAGRTSEEILLIVLNAYGIPCERGRIEVHGYRPDIVVPNNATIRHIPNKAIAIAVKRTLRERWAEDIDVFRYFPNAAFVLLTHDPDFNEDKARDMVNRGMKRIYIPDTLYEASKSFIYKYPQFKKLSDLPLDLQKILERSK